MVPTNGSETCLPLQQSFVQVQRLEGAFCKFPPIQRSYRSLGQATRNSGIAEIRRLKAGRRCAGIRGKRLAIVVTARIGDSEVV